MMSRCLKVGVVFVVVGVFVSAGWSQQQRPARQGVGFGRLEDVGKYVSVVLLLDEATSAKLQAVYKEEGAKYSAAIQGIRQSGGGDREAIRAKSQEEREKAKERIKTALKNGILSEEQIASIEAILVSQPIRQDSSLMALASLKLAPEQRTRMVAVTVPYAVKMASLRPGQGRPAQEGQQEIQKLTTDFKKAAGDILTAEQKKQWEDEAAKIDQQLEKERQARRERAGAQGQGRGAAGAQGQRRGGAGGQAGGGTRPR
jgi:hypothetical protein